MSVIYDSAVKTARMDATRQYFHGGTLQVLTSGNVLLAEFTLDSAAGAVAGDVWSLGFVSGVTPAVASGTAAKAQILNSSNEAHLTGLTVGMTGSADIVIASTLFIEGQDITLTTASITHA